MLRVNIQKVKLNMSSFLFTLGQPSQFKSDPCSSLHADYLKFIYKNKIRNSKNIKGHITKFHVHVLAELKFLSMKIIFT